MSETTPNPCRAVGYIVSDGRKVALVRCQLDESHRERRARIVGYTLSELVVRACDVQVDDDVLEWMPGTPHAVTFEWTDDAELAADWPEVYDPDEPIDVDVPELEPDALARIADEQADAHRERRAFGDD